MDALVLAAGYSKRLEPLTLTQPKPLLPVGGRPMIEYVLDKIRAIPTLRRTLVVSNGKFYEHFVAWSRAYPGLLVVNDGTMDNEHRLGPIRDLELVIQTQSVRDDLLVVAGDNLFDTALDRFAEEGAQHAPLITIGIVNLKDRELIRRRYGIVRMRDDGRVTEFFEKPDDPVTTLVSTGIYYFPASQLGAISAYLAGGGNADNTGYLIQHLVKSPGVHGAVVEGRWYDIGDLASYQLADRTFHKPPA